MLRNLLTLVVLCAVCFFGLASCKKTDDSPKTLEDYQKQAAEEITDENMDAELEKMEKEIEEEISQEP